MSIVIKKVDAIEIFPNEGGGITIKQANSLGDEDSLIVFEIEHTEAVIAGIRAAEKDLKGE